MKALVFQLRKSLIKGLGNQDIGIVLGQTGQFVSIHAGVVFETQLLNSLRRPIVEHSGDDRSFMVEAGYECSYIDQIIVLRFSILRDNMGLKQLDILLCMLKQSFCNFTIHQRWIHVGPKAPELGQLN